MASLTLADAERIIAGARSKMDDMGVKLTIAVVDGRGDLIALARGRRIVAHAVHSAGQSGRVRHLGLVQRRYGGARP